jgi:hypothetical protein
MNLPTRSARLAGRLLLPLALAIFPTSAGAANIEPLPSDGTIYGMKLVDWAVASLQWGNSFPKQSSPFIGYDPKAVRQGVGQRAPVWFVPGTPPAIGTFTVLVPDGEAILFVPAGSTTAAPAGTETEDQLLADRDANADFLNHISPQVALDGVLVPDITRYRVKTPVFCMTLPPGNVFDIGAANGTVTRVAAAGDGFFLLFPPLPVGKHVITHQSLPQVDWTINLIVQKPNEPTQ